INGFGRIGRMAFRAGLAKKDIEFVGINDLTDTATLAHLLKYDSSAGVLGVDVSSTENSLIVDGKEIKVFTEKDPANIPWRDTGAEYVLESHSSNSSKSIYRNFNRHFPPP
ncbi:glyceraldehyde 3-phosphate dehydrogenase NAD-binding domain-containing protein, partial [Thermodesulfobacteriota bacterium]